MHDAAPFQPADLERHRSFLQRLARELVRGEHAAEDLVQEAFVRALERPPASALTLRAWLGQVVRNLALNRGRSRRRAAEREQRVARPETLAPHDEALADLELQERLIAAVKAVLAPGTYALEAETDTGLEAQGAFAVEGLDAQDSPLVFALR